MLGLDLCHKKLLTDYFLFFLLIHIIKQWKIQFKDKFITKQMKPYDKK